MVSFRSFLPLPRKNAPQAEAFPLSSTAPSTALVAYSWQRTPLATPRERLGGTTPETTPERTLERTPRSTLGSTLVEPVPEPIHVIHHAGTIVAVGRQPIASASPWIHAGDLLGFLVNDALFAGQTVTERALRQYYLLVCRQRRLKPFPWLAVVRQFNIRLRGVRGEAHRKTYKGIYEAGRLRKRRVYQVPTTEEVERAIAEPDTVVELAVEMRRRA